MIQQDNAASFEVENRLLYASLVREEEGVSKEECKNVKNVHYNCQGRLYARLKKIHCCHFVIFLLLPVGAAHGTPFYSQHARLNKMWFAAQCEHLHLLKMCMSGSILVA